MESATFKTLETTVILSVAILYTSENQRNVTFLQPPASMRSMDGCEALSTRQILSEIMKISTSWNQVLVMFICIQMDAECNETSPVISFD